MGREESETPQTKPIWLKPFLSNVVLLSRRRESEEARESSGSYVRRGGSSGGRTPCRVEEGSKRRGASIGRSDGAVRIIHFKIAATVGRAGQTTSGRGRTLEARARLERLRLEAEQCLAASSATPNADSELTRLRAQVVELQRSSEETAPVWIVHLHWTMFLHCPLPMSRTWNIG